MSNGSEPGVFSQLQQAVLELNAIKKRFFGLRERRSYRTPHSGYDFSRKSFVEALDLCKDDVAKLRDLREERRCALIEDAIESFNERELERLVERAAYRVKELVRQCIAKKPGGAHRSMDSTVIVFEGIIIDAVESVQHLNKWISQGRKSSGDRPSQDNELGAAVTSTLAQLKDYYRKATSNRPRGYFEHDGIFDIDAYKPAPKAAPSFDHTRRPLPVDGVAKLEALPAAVIEVLPSSRALLESCADVADLELKFKTALDSLDRSRRQTDYNSSNLRIALQRAETDEALQKVVADRKGQANMNLYEYKHYRELLVTAWALRDARARAAALMGQVFDEVSALKVNAFSGVAEQHAIGVYLLYCTDQILQTSGNKLIEVGQKGHLDRYAAMQNEVQAQFAELAAFAQQRMF